MFSFNFFLCHRNAPAFPQSTKRKGYSQLLQLSFLMSNFCLTEGEVCFSLATDLNIQVHFKKKTSHYMKSQLQLLGNADSKGLILHWLSQINSLILRWEDYNQFRFVVVCLFFHDDSPQLPFILVKPPGQSNNICHINWTTILAIISYFLLGMGNN